MERVGSVVGRISCLADTWILDAENEIRLRKNRKWPMSRLQLNQLIVRDKKQIQG
jgi:hypothetical protein